MKGGGYNIEWDKDLQTYPIYRRSGRTSQYVTNISTVLILTYVQYLEVPMSSPNLKFTKQMSTILQCQELLTYVPQCLSKTRFRENFFCDSLPSSPFFYGTPIFILDSKHNRTSNFVHPHVMEYQDITNLSPFVYHEDFSCGPTNKKPKPVSLVGLFRPCPAVGPVAPTVPSRVPS